MSNSQKSSPAAGTQPAPAASHDAPQSAVAMARSKARGVGRYVNSWVGLSPSMLNSPRPDGEQEQRDIDDVLGMPIVVYGYSTRTGEKSDFAVILCSEKDKDELWVVVSGAAVVLKKLNKIAEGNHFPVSGKIIKSTGKQFEYYDFVD